VEAEQGPTSAEAEQGPWWPDPAPATRVEVELRTWRREAGAPSIRGGAPSIRRRPPSSRPSRRIQLLEADALRHRRPCDPEALPSPRLRGAARRRRIRAPPLLRPRCRRGQRGGLEATAREGGRASSPPRDPVARSSPPLLSGPAAPLLVDFSNRRGSQLPRRLGMRMKGIVVVPLFF
jgi:hypothetical protein